MFVPEWPSSGEDDKETHNNTGIAMESVTGMLAESETNGERNNNQNNVAITNDDAIELTHDDTTGITSVNSGDDEGDAMERSASSPEQDEGDRNHETAADNNTNVLSSFGGGDIWSTEAFAFESPLKDLLDSNNFSLGDLLAQDELLQELRGCEARLVDYFSKPEVVAGLVECLICEVPYINQDRGKERWCKEETERRKQMAEETQRREKSGKTASNENGNNDEDDADFWPKRSDPTTVLASSEPNNDNPNIEASWNSPDKNQSIIPNNQGSASDQRSPEEEYDMRYVRYPYMACEVFCSDVGSTLDVLVSGYEDVIDDDEDSLLNDTTGEVRMQEIKTTEQEEIYDSVNVYLDDEPNGDLSSGPSLIADTRVQLPQMLDPPPTPRNTRTPRRRILDLLFAVIIDTPPSSLDDRRAGYFEKILVILFRKYSQAMSDYMNTSLVITAKSTEMTQKSSGKEFLCMNGHQESAYISLMPSMDSLGNESDGQILPSSLNHISTTLPLPNFLSDKAPPMLMCALFDHLHSHSIMHIIHRLLMPRQQQNAKEVKNNKSGDVDDAESDNPNGAINDQFMNAINQMNQNGTSNGVDDEADDDDLEDEMNHLFQCDWSEQPSHAFELLLSRLEGHTEPFLLKYKFPVGYNVSHLENVSDSPPSEAENYDAKLSCAQHASEILISIIQNSPLDSPVMISLSSDPLLSRILQLTALGGSNEVPIFVPHESMMTCAMTVLENLILQLGGYGAVSLPSASAAASGSQLPSSPSPAKETDKSFSLTELGPHTPATSPAPPDSTSSVATTAALIVHLPALLEELSSLLVHPVTKTWTTPTQYTHLQPRPILGISRLRILRLIESLVLLGDPTADLLLQQSDCLECCLDLFWNFEWCSMLHQSVANFLVQVFEAGNHRAGLQDYFIIRCRLLEKLMNSFSDGSFFAEKGGDEPKVTENGSIDAATVESTTQFGDDIVMAMKTMFKDHVTSSVESLDGSESDSSNDRQVDVDDGDAVAHVSEDDIESAMEKEEQENQATSGMSSLSSATGNAYEANTEAGAMVSNHPISQRHEESSFRRGYMGHVIIICQAIVNACNASSKTSLQNNSTDEAKADDPQNDSIIQNFSSTTEFDSSAVQCITDDSVISHNRRDLSPTRLGDAPMSPIAKVPSSPIEVQQLAQSPLDLRLREDLNELPHIALVIREHPLFERWASFISSTLATEMMTQSKPLGGQHTAKDLGASVSSDSKNRFVSVIDDDSDNDFLGVDNGVFGELTMDENDLDIAAQMMESLSLTSPNTGDVGSDEPLPIGHNRRNRVIGGGMLMGCQKSLNSQERNIGNFGSLIHSTNTIGSKEYIYDDPLGQVRPFDNDDSSDEDDTHFTATISKESLESNTGRLNRSCSTDEEDDDDSPRVMDLFTGNFAVNNVTGSSITNESFTQENNSSDDNMGWANFANFEDAFTLDDVTSATTGSPS